MGAAAAPVADPQVLAGSAATTKAPGATARHGPPGMADTPLGGVDMANPIPHDGPLEHEPRVLFEAATMTAVNAAALADALEGVALGAHDRRILDWLAGWEPSTVATVASLVRRARAAGPVAS